MSKCLCFFFVKWKHFRCSWLIVYHWAINIAESAQILLLTKLLMAQCWLCRRPKFKREASNPKPFLWGSWCALLWAVGPGWGLRPVLTLSQNGLNTLISSWGLRGSTSSSKYWLIGVGVGDKMNTAQNRKKMIYPSLLMHVQCWPWGGVYREHSDMISLELSWCSAMTQSSWGFSLARLSFSMLQVFWFYVF